MYDVAEEFFLNLLSNYLFPIAVTAFVMVRLETTVKENTKAINALSEEIKKRN